jgi:uncharacterized protein with FMN-binding domain
MRRITLWLLGTVAAVVLMFSYRTSTSSGGPVAGPQNVAAAPGVVSTGQPATDGATGGAPSTTDTVVNGGVAQTRWGPVQVQVHIAGGRISDISVLQQPSGNRTDREINSYALPQLRQQTLQAQNANIDGVSGATVTSDGYRQSLQSALDSAHFGG